MYASGPDFEDEVWRRLQIISVEDVGFGRLDAPVLIRTLDEFRRAADRTSADRLIYLVHAVRVLALSQKDRTADEMTNWARDAVETGAAKPEVFDDAIDMHTIRGQTMGRDFRHWFENGARVENELPKRDLTYRERVLAMIDRKENG
jgi:hypothetical protein